MHNSNSLEIAIQEQDVIAARTAILSCLDSDKRHSKPQALQMAKSISEKFTNPNNPLFQEEDPDFLGEIPLKSLWNETFFDRIKAAMYANFSQEKIKLAEEVIAVLREKGLPDFQVEETSRTKSSTQKNVNLGQAQQSSKTSTGDEKRRRSSPKPRFQSDHSPQEDFLEGMLVGGVVLGGAGLIVGLVAGCALKAAVTGAIVGGIAGGFWTQNRNHK